MLSWQVGRVKITRIVEMDLPVPAKVIPQATAAELRKSATSSATAQRSGLRCEGNVRTSAAAGRRTRHKSMETTRHADAGPA